MPKLVTDQYKELMHYTSAVGLTGIVSSRCLWATHAAHLNDSEEIKLFLDRRLRTLISTEIGRIIAEQSELPEHRAHIQSFGGVDRAAIEATDGLWSSIRRLTLAFNQPYILSLCGAADDRVQLSGLLSQWRGYGKDGGYAVVLNTSAMQSLLEAEARQFSYQMLQWADVHYYDEASPNAPVAEEISEAEDTLKAAVGAFMWKPGPEALEPTFEAITSLSCLYKHWGFHEEREVRVLAIPSHESTLRPNGGSTPQRPPKPIKTLVRDGSPMAYLELFRNGDPPATRPPLPITRVIVGPHRDKLQRKEATERLLLANGVQAQVVVSEIPYLGR
jgi:hypothetical protein